jgi:hypothetical protein
LFFTDLTNQKKSEEMKNLTTRHIRKFGALVAISFLSLLASEEILAQFINNQRARMDVRGTSRRTARRVNRRHDAFNSGSSDVYNEEAPVAEAAAVGAAAAVLYSLPAGCRDNNGIFDCNGIHYQAQMQGSQVVYVQIN